VGSEPKVRERWFRRHPRLALVMIFVVGVTVCDVTIGSALHAMGVALPGMSREHLYRSRHPIYHHGLRPNASVDGIQWGTVTYDVRTDSLGFKNAEVREVPLRSDSKRVVLMGDSFTEGIGVNYEDTFAGMLNRRFAAEGFEFLNAGVATYSPIVFLRKFEHLIDTVGLKFDHALVFIDMSDIRDEIYYSFDDDGNIVNKRDASFSEAVKRFLSNNTVLIGIARRWIHQVRKSNETEADARGLNKWRVLWADEEEAWRAYGEEGLALATERMNLVDALLKKHAVTLSIVVYPWPDQIMRKNRDNRQASHWKNWAAEHSAGFVDCFPAFIDGTPPGEMLDRCFIRGDVHWNRAGHQIMADQLTLHLAEW
jgi:lysophospholipase L1-like esterase